MPEHVKRGATLYRDREVEHDITADDAIIGVWHCTECGEKLELRQREGRHSHTEIGCSCGAASLDLRVADLLDLDVEEWDTERLVADGGNCNTRSVSKDAKHARRDA